MVARRSRPHSVVSVTVMLLALLAACSCSSGSSRSASPSDAKSSQDVVPAPTSRPGPVPTFTGTADDFYRVPDPLPKGQPGALIRVQPVSESGGTILTRVMYHSRDLHDRDRAVTGLVDYPTAAAPPSGWPVLSWDHGTTGISAGCAPSRLGQTVPAFGTQGVHVATDYLGLGPVGEIHPYLQKMTEAQATVDIVRAVRNIAAAHAGKRWVVVGHSQGGHASLSTGELAPAYAPELDLVGTVAIAPAAELTSTIPGEADIVPDIVTTIAMYGQAADNPDVRLDKYLTPAAQKVAPLMASSCLDQVQGFLVGVATAPGSKIFNLRLRDDPAGRRLLAANEVGTRKFRAPLLVVGGGKDALVVPGRIDALMKRLCGHGDTVQRIVLPDADHGSEPSAAVSQIKAWVEARFANQPAPKTC